MLLSNTQGNKLAGFFKGVVVKHLEHGKCKIWIPGVYPDGADKEPDSLPDAIQVSPMFGGSCSGNGVFTYPNLGSVVICGFLNEDQNFPIYWGTIQGGDNAKKQYADVRCDPSDDSVKSGDDARIHKIRVDHATIKIAESGQIEIKTFKDRKYCTGKEQPDEGCQINISEDGVVNIKASTQVCINTPDLMINTERYTLNCQTMKVNAGNQSELNTQTLNINAEEQVDIKTKSANHKQNAFNVTSKDQTRVYSDFIALVSKNHPPVFL